MSPPPPGSWPPPAGPANLSALGWPAFPAGYGLAVVGVVFAVGGAGDMTWHSIFGIEQDVEALFSPTHVLLFAGMALILLATVLLLVRRWRLPFGSATTIYASVGVLIGAVDACHLPTMVAAAVLAGLAVDGLLRLLGPSAERHRRFWATGALVPLITWNV